MLANLVDILKALNVLKLILPGKNIDCINDCDVINAFVAKLELGIVEFKKETPLLFVGVNRAPPFPEINVYRSVALERSFSALYFRELCFILVSGMDAINSA